MAARERRERKHVERLGDFANDEALEELHLESEVEGEVPEAEEARGAVAKAARRGGGGGRAAPLRPVVTADMLSTLLAGAPALVDYLLLEDSVRSITLCCRDVVNLNIAAGGGVNLEPVWQALASHIKAKAAAEAAAAAEQAAVAAADGSAPLAQPNDLQPGAPAPAAPLAGPAVPLAVAAEPGAGVVPAQAQAELAGRRTRRGHTKRAKPPPVPSALDVVKAAVAADPARSADVRKTTAPWVYKISQKSVTALPAHKGQYGRMLYCRELDIRTVAWQRWGDQAGMEDAKKRAIEQFQNRQELYERRMNEEREARHEELAIRLAENGLPPNTAQDQFNVRLRDWVDWGSLMGGTLDDMLERIIARHQQLQEAQERERQRKERAKLLDDSLEAEGLQFFKRNWRYRCFINSGVADGLPVLLGTARRQLEARQAEGERHRELAERLDAADLPFHHSTSPMFAQWLKTGEGDIGAIVQQRRLQVDRECQLQYLLEVNGLLHRQNSERCKKFIAGELLHRSCRPYTAKEVVSSLLTSLGKEHSRCQELLDRLREERLPPDLHHIWCQTYVQYGGDLEAVVCRSKEYVHSRANVRFPPPGRRWEAACDSTGAQAGAPAPLDSLPVSLRLLRGGQPVRAYTMDRAEDRTNVAVMFGLPPGHSVTDLGMQLLNETGEQAAAVVLGEVSFTWQDGWQDVTWDAKAAGSSRCGAAISLPSIKAPDAPNTMRRESIRFVSSNPPLDLSLALHITAGLPRLLPMDPAVAADGAADGKGEAEEGAQGSQQGVRKDQGCLETGVEEAAVAAEAMEEEQADGYAAEADRGAEDGSQRSGGAGTAAATNGAAGFEQAMGSPLPAPDPQAGQQLNAGGKTPSSLADETGAAGAAKAGQSEQESGGPQQEQGPLDEDGPADAMQE